MVHGMVEKVWEASVLESTTRRCQAPAAVPVSCSAYQNSAYIEEKELGRNRVWFRSHWVGRSANELRFVVYNALPLPSPSPLRTRAPLRSRMCITHSAHPQQILIRDWYQMACAVFTRNWVGEAGEWVLRLRI